MRDVEDEPERIYAADSESAQDEPGPSDFSGMTFDIWQRLTWNNPACDRDVSTVAIVDGELVGASFLYTDRETGRATNSGTGVMRAYRGRGLGLLMKHHSLAAAAAARNHARRSPRTTTRTRRCSRSTGASATSSSRPGTPGCSSGEPSSGLLIETLWLDRRRVLTVVEQPRRRLAFPGVLQELRPGTICSGTDPRRHGGNLATAGLEEVGRPTIRRVVMRVDF